MKQRRIIHSTIFMILILAALHCGIEMVPAIGEESKVPIFQHCILALGRRSRYYTYRIEEIAGSKMTVEISTVSSIISTGISKGGKRIVCCERSGTRSASYWS
ncbi:MAG: hypothetical protein QW193_03815 [Nitrososphaerales archaeon]